MTISCSSSAPRQGTPQISKNEKFRSEEKLLDFFEALLSSKNYIKLKEELTKSFSQDPNPYHWYSMMFYYGLAFEETEDWSGAASIYQQIIDRSINREMEYVALAFYRRAFCYEVLLENEKALASLTDAFNLKAYLPMEVTLAEIPARIASLHARFGQKVISDQFTLIAEEGINKLKFLNKMKDSDRVIRTLVKMGSVSLTQIDEEGFRQNILSITRNQRYLIQAIELNHPIWSQEAQKSLLLNYSNLWNFILNYKVPPTLDRFVDQVSESSKKTEMLSLYLEALENLKNYEAPLESKEFKKTELVYLQIKNIENQALSLLSEEMLKKPWGEGSSDGLINTSRLPSSTLNVNERLPSSTNKDFLNINEDFLTPEDLNLRDDPLYRSLPKKVKKQ